MVLYPMFRLGVLGTLCRIRRLQPLSFDRWRSRTPGGEPSVLSRFALGALLLNRLLPVQDDAPTCSPIQMSSAPCEVLKRRISTQTRKHLIHQAIRVVLLGCGPVG